MLIPSSLLTSILSHAREAYPAECCGMLIGHRPEADARAGEPHYIVTRIYPATNRATEHERYDIDPLEVHGADKTTRGTDEEIIGFYHSHPDHGAEPSDHDTDLAWVSYCYLIVNVERGGEAVAQAWVRHEDKWEAVTLVVE